MEVQDIPGMLQERLGMEATASLVLMFNQERRIVRDDVLNLAAERFERRLVEETAKLRVETAQGFSSLLKWMFLFWVGQVGAVAALMGFMLAR